MSSKNSVHVVPRDGGWAVKREGSSRDSSHHERKSDALDTGRATARREGVEFVTHGKDGRIQDSDSYGNDPNPPKDRKH